MSTPSPGLPSAPAPGAAPVTVTGPEGVHLEQGLVASYAQGSLPAERRASVERHLDRCAVCREALGTATPAEVTEAGWQQLSLAVDAPSRSLAERAVTSLGVPEHVARLAMATPVMRRSWIGASLVTLLFTVIAARLSPGASAVLLLMVAPLIPAAGVAVSYGPAFDPMHELGLVMPTQALRLILFRSTTVLIASTAVSALVTLALPEQGAAVFGWLAPSLAVTSLTLALSAFFDPLVAAQVTGAGWLVVSVLAAGDGVRHSALLTVPGQAAVASLALVCAVFIAAQRHRFEHAVRGRRPGRPAL
ncbi:anti-sigma factor family protein [Streptomyces drozdowiczii]